MNLPAEDWPDFDCAWLAQHAGTAEQVPQGRLAYQGLRKYYSDLPPKMPLEWEDAKLVMNPNNDCVTLPRGAQLTLDTELKLSTWNWYTVPPDTTEHGLGSAAWHWAAGDYLLPYIQYHPGSIPICHEQERSRRAARGGFGYWIIYAPGIQGYPSYPTREEFFSGQADNDSVNFTYLCRIEPEKWAIIWSVGAYNFAQNPRYSFRGNYYWVQDTPEFDPRGDYSFDGTLTEEWLVDGHANHFWALRNLGTDSNPADVTITVDMVYLV